MVFDKVQLKDQLQNYEKSCGMDEPFSILEFLFYWYSTTAPVDDGRILKSEHALVPILEALPIPIADSLYDRVSDLCLSYQRAAFLEGLRIGYGIKEELEA